MKKNTELFHTKESLTSFKEPVLFLIRRNKNVEFFEDATKGNFIFKHSDGNTRETYLDVSGQLTFDYGKKKFRGYIIDEDNPLPLPENPRVNVDAINGIVEKATMDIKKLNLKGQEIKLKTWKILGFFILGAIILLILWQTHAFEKIIGMITGNPWVENQIQKVVTPSIENIINNNSLAISSGT